MIITELMETSFFWIKKIAGDMLMPFPVSIGLLVLAMFFLLRPGGRRTSFYLVFSSTLLLLFAGTRVSSDPFAETLEARYAPRGLEGSTEGIKWVVVLSAGQRDDKRYPPHLRLGPATPRCRRAL